MTKRSILKSIHQDPKTVTSCKRRGMKIVRWGEMVVFEFPNLLGDNPAVSGGAPLTIGWNHDTVNIITVDDNEIMRLEKPRRRRKEMVLSSTQRDTVSDTFSANNLYRSIHLSHTFRTLLQYLLGLGYSLDQLLNAAEEVRKIQRSRQAQVKSMKTWKKFMQVFEGATRSLRHGTPHEPKILVAKCG
jgi:hypothetical protein